MCLIIANQNKENFAQIGTFEGTFDDTAYGGHLYLCQNGDTLQGQYSEVGIINGVVSNNTASGKFYQAGFSKFHVFVFDFQLLNDSFSSR